MNVAFINQRRKELNLSIPQLAEASGIPQGTVSKITAGISKNPRLETLRALCKALNCTLDDLDDSTPISESFVISDFEKLLIMHYRDMPQMQAAINSLLGLAQPNDCHTTVRVK